MEALWLWVSCLKAAVDTGSPNRYWALALVVAPSLLAVMTYLYLDLWKRSALGQTPLPEGGARTSDGAAPPTAALGGRRRLFAACMVLLWAVFVVLSAAARQRNWSWWLVFATVPVVMAGLSYLYLDLGYQAALGQAPPTGRDRWLKWTLICTGGGILLGVLAAFFFMSGLR